MKKIFSTIILLAVNILFAVFLAFPQYQKALMSETQAAAAQANYDSTTAYYASVMQGAEELAARKTALQKIDNALPTGFSSSALVYFLQQKSSETGIAIKSVTFSSRTSPGVIKSGPQEMVFDIVVSGSYSQLKQFLTALEKSDRLFEVESINFLSAPSQSSPTGQQVSFRLRVKTYYYNS